MNREEKINLLVKLGDSLLNLEEDMEPFIKKAYYDNLWFTEENSTYQLNAIREDFLQEEKLRKWTEKYDYRESEPKTIALILAGNIPLVGFHDILCVFLSGHKAIVKLSDKDKTLYQGLFRIMHTIDDRVQDWITTVDRVEDFDAVIATGSANTNRYFEYYFRDYPSLLRSSRSSFAIVDSTTKEEEVDALMDDVFIYFGLGCRSVSKVFLPENFDLDLLFKASLRYKEVQNHPKFKNNFKYNTATLLMNKDSFLTNDIFILKEDSALVSRIGVLHYEFYQDEASIETFFTSYKDEIQCVVGNHDDKETVPYGRSQRPRLSDYADHIDTMKFLNNL